MRSGNFGVGSWIERRARIAPGDVALIANGRRLTYGDLAARVRRLANALRAAGVRRGDRVAWVGPNHASFLELLFATGQAGAALAPEADRPRRAPGRAGRGAGFRPRALDRRRARGPADVVRGRLRRRDRRRRRPVPPPAHLGDDRRAEGRDADVAVPDDASADGILGLMERERVTVGFGNPDSLDALMRTARWPVADLSRLRCVLTGGAPVPERLIRAWLARGVPLLQGYGLSEASPVVSVLDPRDALAKIGAAGKPMLFVDVRVVGDAGEDVAPGDVGELLVRGPNVMAGYWRRPDATREVLGDDGWLRTGDAARLDADGTLWIVGRVGDTLTVRGRRVLPGDVERVLLLHPSVADAAVTVAGDVVVALVVVAAGAEIDADAVIAHCRGSLAAEQVPERVVFVGAIPRSPVGKILRYALPALVAG